MSTVPAIGERAPDFTLEGWGHGERAEYTLSARLGQPVVLAFYPADDSLVCTKQLCSYSDDLSQFKDLGAEVWGISGQTIESHQRFAEKRGIGFPLLADPSKTVVDAYGIGGPLGLKRSVFVIDAEGKVAWSHVAKLGVTFKSTETITKVLAEL